MIKRKWYWKPAGWYLTAELFIRTFFNYKNADQEYERAMIKLKKLNNKTAELEA